MHQTYETEHKTTNVENPELQNSEKQIVEEDKIKKFDLNERILLVIKTTRDDVFEYYNDSSKFGKDNEHLNDLFTVTKNLNYSDNDLSNFKITIEKMFKEIENDLKQAMQDKGLQKYYEDEYNKMKDKYKVGLVNICNDHHSVSSQTIFKIIYDKYNAEYLNQRLHIIEIAKEYKNIITI
ncbi:hypothetical protein COBT_003937, partial [Conglomerata obtusa]